MMRKKHKKMNLKSIFSKKIAKNILAFLLKLCYIIGLVNLI